MTEHRQGLELVESRSFESARVDIDKCINQRSTEILYIKVFISLRDGLKTFAHHHHAR